jgi:hypothetical protein
VFGNVKTLKVVEDHLLTKCNYMEALWHGFAAGMALPSYADMASSAGPIEWVSFVISTSEKSERRNKLGLLVAFGWHI